MGYPKYAPTIYHRTMPALPRAGRPQQFEPALQLVVELPSRWAVFFGNLRDLIFPRQLKKLELRSAPAPFWPDVFVKRGLPWLRFLESGAYHVIALALLIAAAHLIALQPRPVVRAAFDRSQIVYTPAEYLPPIDTRVAPSAAPTKADPEYAPQPIISVPPEADNRSQTIVAPPSIKLKQDVSLPNVVAWSDKEETPRLWIPPVPMTPASEITRMGPRIDESVVTPPPDAAQLARRREEPNLQAAIVAPPPEFRTSRTATEFAAPEPAVVAPPPALESAPTRQLGQINIARSSVIAPAPQLPVVAQRAIPGGKSSQLIGVAPRVVPPPPAVSASGSGGQSFGSPGRLIALNLHPAVGAPPNPPAGNRRGAFASTPEGHAGASGSPGSTGSGNRDTGGIVSTQKINDLPSGLYVGKAASTTSPVSGGSSAKTAESDSPRVVASVHPPRVSSTPAHAASPGNAAKLSEPERAVFGDRRFYSLTLNMPNLNSAGGSWVIRFAEIKQDPNAPPVDLSEPTATRKVDPGYPSQLIRERLSGTVILYAVIRADGTVGDVRVLRGVDDRLDHFASQAVQKWQFQPAMKNGSPIDVEATFQIPFRPPRTNF
jgi:TonB family protein